MDQSLNRFRTYLRVSEAFRIARRLFVMNAFDGILTIMGVVIGAHYSGLSDPEIVVKAGVGGSIALGISGMSSAYLAERAERRRDLKKLESAMLADLKKSQFARASQFATVVVALVNGISPAIGAIILVLPYLLVPAIDMEEAFRLSLGLGLACLFFLGLFLAKISQERMIASGLKMILVGLLTIAVVSLVSAPGGI
ncbi:VIT1/CCC1 transporter family protein [Methanotrichaceae archaeon M04Ac]|uniref:VIT1/CCC1 transporter family protein n=1 Tax=Candidatus Methanocrinis alkalitolerans TaxID=3033395 RepID=A0ABT5XH04_9EURY|nr:VIT1/CCC1 transporter family protein [Candidatus Methanocrinis alkalitolerans]MDF0593908.1 VIT1/CCC1 transporter family protein [Candidatus Methanocrinis alkalitolerans]